MATLKKLFEKALTSLLVSLLLMFASFSYLTGRFPPRKDDIAKGFAALKEILTSSASLNGQMKALGGQSPSLEQIVELQRLGLQRSEAALKFTKLMARLPQSNPPPEMNARIQKAQEHLAMADQEIADLNSEMAKMMEAR